MSPPSLSPLASTSNTARLCWGYKVAIDKHTLNAITRDQPHRGSRARKVAVSPRCAKTLIIAGNSSPRPTGSSYTTNCCANSPAPISADARATCQRASYREPGLLDLAVRTAKEIPGEDGRNENLWAIAITAAKVGNSTLAQQLLSCLSVAHEEHIFTLTSILAERGEKSTFLAILPLCGWSRTIAFKACFSIATLYPQHHLAVLKLLARELGVGRDGESDSEKIS